MKKQRILTPKPLSALLGTLQALIKIVQKNEIMIEGMFILDVEALRFKREVVGAGLTEEKVLTIEIKGSGWKKLSRNPSKIISRQDLCNHYNIKVVHVVVQSLLRIS